MTENNKWTPGPWTATDPMTADREGEGTYAHVSSFEDGFGNICTVWSENAHANARLIAAAPELAEALENCIAAMGEGGSCSISRWTDALFAANAARAKARGES